MAIVTRCSHLAAFLLRELIIQKCDLLPQNDPGFPFAYGKNVHDQFSFDIVNPSYNKKGIYRLRTPNVFGTNLQNTSISDISKRII